MAGKDGGEYPAVTIAVTKKPHENAVVVADRLLARVAELGNTVIPTGIEVTVTRNYGETATEKSNELLLHMGIAVIGVSGGGANDLPALIMVPIWPALIPTRTPTMPSSVVSRVESDI